MFSVRWHPKVRKFLRKLPKGTAARIVLKSRDLMDNPFHYLEHFEGEGCYKFRVGDYQMLVDVDNDKKELFVRVIGHRKNIYKKK